VDAAKQPGAAVYGWSPNVSSWGASLLAGSDGQFDLFVSQMKSGGLVGWGSESECVHATSSQRSGPYVKQSVMLGNECHGTVVIRDPQKKDYLLFHQGIGSAANKTSRSQPGNFMHISKTPRGPWIPAVTTPSPVIVGKGRGQCGMPTAAFHPNGSLFVVCGNGHQLVASTGVNQPWRSVTTLNTPPKWEDPTLWFDRRGAWHIIYHVWAADPFEKHNEPSSVRRKRDSRVPLDVCARLTLPVGLQGHAFSLDGVEWTFSDVQPFNGSVAFTDGTAKQFATRERPQLTFVDELHPLPGATALRTTPNGLTSAVNSQPLGPWCEQCSMHACSQCKVTAGRDWTYTIFQPLATAAAGPV